MPSASPIDENQLREMLDTAETRTVWASHHPSETFDNELSELIKWLNRPKSHGRPADLAAFWRDTWPTSPHTIKRVNKSVTKAKLQEPPQPLEYDDEMITIARNAGLSDDAARDSWTIFAAKRSADLEGKPRAYLCVRWTQWCSDECLYIARKAAQAAAPECSRSVVANHARNALNNLYGGSVHASQGNNSRHPFDVDGDLIESPSDPR